MKRFLLLVLAVLLFAQGVHAESSPVSGATLTNEARPDRGLKWDQPNICNAQIACGNAFTSAPIDTRGWNWMAVSIYVAPETGTADSATFGYFAIQVRGGGVAATDTMSSFPWLAPNPARAAGAGASSSIDTIGVTARYTPGVVSDVGPSLPAGNFLLPGEKLVVIQYADGKRSGWVMLESNGQYFRAPFTTIRIRPLYMAGTTAINSVYTAMSATIQASLWGGR